MTIQDALTAEKTVSDFLASLNSASSAPPQNTVVVGEATMFALNWNGTIDRSDNGVGAWGAKTANKLIMGASLPEAVLIATAGLQGTWAQCKEAVGKWLSENQVQARVTRNGQMAMCDIVDAGPSRSTHNFIDLTYAPAHLLGTNGKAIVSTEVLANGQPIEIKGWDIKNGVEINMPGTT